MPDHRRWIRSLLVVPGIVLLSSCSLIWPDAPEPLPADRTVSLRIDAAAGVNTDSGGNSLRSGSVYLKSAGMTGYRRGSTGMPPVMRRHRTRS
ncbi:hypothetical protein UA45_17380 [Morganella morganii]|uniref:Lipoprotein n=1 Tax=Morganella morganii TaxID=582 RepID=A0A0D8L798_MORMO|nr:hypothetical protein UA45_17380 [Morganella morganii]